VAPQGRLSRVLALFVPLLAWSVAIVRGASGAQWRADLPALRDRGLAGVGFSGAVSSVVTQAFGVVPLGSQAERAAAGSAMATAVASALLFRAGQRVLLARFRERSAEPRSSDELLASVLAAVAALTAALSPSWQAEATVGGGAAVALALVFAGLEASAGLCSGGSSLSAQATRGWLGVAAWVGLALAESPPAALALALVAAAMIATSERRPPLRLVVPAFALVLALAVVLVLPTLWRPFAPASLADVRRVLSSTGLRALPRSSGREAVLSWMQQLGLVQLGLAGLGFVVGAARARLRSSVMMLVALPLFDLLCPVSQWLDGTPTSYRQLCVASFALGATLGVAEIVCFLRGLELPMARFASVLAVVFHMTLAAVVCEEASFTSDRTERLAAEEWTDLALARLPRDAAVVVRSPDLAWRLWSAQRVEGQRPDVLLVASPLLVRSSGLARLLPHGAEVAPLLRDLTLTGSASEFGLSVLADARPLRVELDAAWDEQMLGHVMVDGPWLRFDPEALGSSDRPADGTSALSAEARIAAHVRGGARRDQVSAEVLGRTLKEQTTALALLGLSSASSPLLDELDRLLPNDPFAVSARLRVEHAVRQGHTGAVELRDLLRF